MKVVPSGVEVATPSRQMVRPSSIPPMACRPVQIAVTCPESSFSVMTRAGRPDVGRVRILDTFPQADTGVRKGRSASGTDRIAESRPGSVRRLKSPMSGVVADEGGANLGVTRATRQDHHFIMQMENGVRGRCHHATLSKNCDHEGFAG